MDEEWVVHSFHINVGAGDSAIHIRAKASFTKPTEPPTYEYDRVVLVDGGDGNNDGCNRMQKLLEELPSLYTNTPVATMLPLDAIVVTHWDADHWEGIQNLMEANQRQYGSIPFLKSKSKGLTTIYAPDDKFPKKCKFTVEQGDPLTITLGHSKKCAKFYHGETLIGADFFEDFVPRKDNLPGGGAKGLYSTKGNGYKKPAMFCVACNKSTISNHKISVIDSPITVTNMRSIANIIVWPGGKVSHYFAGDLNYQNESRIVDWIGKDVTIPNIKLSHHGAKSSTPLDMLVQYKPTNVIISAGERNGHPSPETLLYLIGYFDSLAQGSRLTDVSSSLWLTQYPHWMRIDDNNDYAMFHRFSTQPFLQLPSGQTGKAAKILKYQEAIAKYFGTRKNTWQIIQIWAKSNTTNNTVSRPKAFNFIAMELSKRLSQICRIRPNTGPGCSSTSTGAANCQGDQVWFIGVLQADPLSKRLEEKNRVYYLKQSEKLKIDVIPQQETNKRRHNAIAGADSTPTSQDKQAANPFVEYKKVKKTPQIPPGSLITLVSAAGGNDKDEEEILFENPKIDPGHVPYKITWALCCSSFLESNPPYIPEFLAPLPVGHAWDSFVATLPHGIIGFDTPDLQSTHRTSYLAVHTTDDAWLSWMRSWAGVESIFGVFDEDLTKNAGTAMSIPSSFQLSLRNGVTFSTLNLDEAVVLDHKPDTDSRLGTFPGTGMIGFGLSPDTTPWEGTGSNIMKTLGDYTGWDSTLLGSSQSSLASLVLKSTWHLKQTHEVVQRGSAIWYTPFLGDLTTIRLEFGLGEGSDGFKESLNKILGKIGSSVSLADLGMTFKWYSSRATTQGDEEKTEVSVQGFARIWLHSKLTLSSNADSLDIEIDVLRDDGDPAITLRCGPNLLTIDKLSIKLGNVIGLPETSVIRANIPGDFFSDIAFRRAVLPYDANATSFAPKSLALDFEAIFHAKGDNDSLVSANICIAYQADPPRKLRFRASLWTPNLSPLVKGLPYQLLPAYEVCDDYGPQPKAASSISLLKLIPGLEVSQPPAGIPTDVTALGFGYEDKTVAIWGTLENCTLPGDRLPTISLGQMSINGTWGPRGKYLSLQLAVQISPPDNLIDLDSTLGPSLLTGIFSYDSNNGWDIEANVADLSLAHVWQFFDSSQQTALVKVMGSIMVRSLSIRYKMQKSASVTIAQQATELQIKGDVEIGLGRDESRPPHLLFEYNYPLDGQWTMKLGFEETVSQDITIERLLGTLSPDDELLKSIIEQVGSLVLVRRGTSSGLAIQVSPEAQGTKKNMNLRAKLQIDRFVFTYCQYTSTEENGVLKRFLLISLNQFEIPMPNIPVLKQFKSPFDSLYILWTDSDIKRSDLAALDPSLATAMATYSTTNDKDEEAFQAGFHTGIMSNGEVLLNHTFGKQTTKKTAPDAQDNGNGWFDPAVLPPERKVDTTSNTSTVKFQKRLGPLTISNIGLKFESGNIVVVLNATLEVGPIEMKMMDFGLGLKLSDLSKDTFTFVPSLSGFGLAIDSPPLDLAGALIKRDDFYMGGVMAAFKPYIFQAVGAYGTIKMGSEEVKTAFVILALGGPLLNINGIEISDVTAGFGYNSDIRFPDPSSVSLFPLIAMGQPPAPLDPLQIFTQLAETTWFTPVADSFWVGAGVRGSAFNMLDAKIAAVFKIQNGVLSHIGVFADCKAQMPKSGATKLFASVELGITAVFDLVNGSMLVSGCLSPNSYVIDSSCHLTGGFAAATWFGPSPYAGDWVFALGGYHPKFTPPAYYPREIPQIGISWQVSDQVFAKAGAYFAITPKTCMGGASMLATCDACGLHASFSALIDFLMNFDPFHYVLEVLIDISVSWSDYVLFIWVSFGFDITASLYMCGPPVYGTFTIKVPIKNVTVTFGDSNGQNAPGKASLGTFRGMLQQNGQGAKEEVKISCGSGLSSKDDTTGVWTVRAGTFAFDVRSNMATTQAYLNGTAVGAANKVYAKPMQLTESSNGLKADLIITITGISSDDQYRPDLISGNLPAALWSSYDATKDPSVSNADKSALLDGSASTISSAYGLSVRTPKPHLSKDVIKPFKISNVIFPIILETGATSAPVPPCAVQDGSWEGKEAAGETITQKREKVRNIWKDANTRREAFATAWVEAMGWTEFKAVTQTPTQLIDGFDKLVRGTPLISCG
ncbi:transcriptional activator srcap [Fusarium sp. NRRL 52700]|nr:transcriptional activator srcap [Fusarium sp. NRRL 52700]